MSLATRTSVVGALNADSGVKSLLSAHPTDAAKAAILPDNMLPPPVYPCIAYRVDSDTPDPRFRPTNAEGGGPSPVSEERMELRIWSKSQDPAVREAIATAVRAVLEGRTLMAAGAFRVEIIVESPDNYTPSLNAFFHLIRLRLRTYTP